MASYNLEEQEQLSELKTWWKLHGNQVTTMLLVVTVVVVGWQGWQFYQHKQAAGASILYAEVQNALLANDDERVKKVTGELVEQYPGTAYAALAALNSARMQFDAGNFSNARLQLRWVADKSHDKDLRDLARLRLSQVLIDENQLDDALAILKDVPEDEFGPRFIELRGDILLLQNKKTEARSAYETAIARLDAIHKSKALQDGQDIQYKNLLQMKLDAAGEH